MEIIYVLPDIEKVDDKWRIDYIGKDGDKKAKTICEMYDEKEPAIKRYNELVKLSLVKNF